MFHGYPGCSLPATLMSVDAGAESGDVPCGRPTDLCVPLQAVRKQRRGRFRGVLGAAVPVHQRHDERRVRPDRPGEGRSSGQRRPHSGPCS